MTTFAPRRRFRWHQVAPVVGVVVMAFAFLWSSMPVTLLAVAALVGAVLAAVHHAEVIAHRVGEPFGSLVLAVSVTVIEVGLIVALMNSGGPAASTLARDTVFSAVMITTNGIIGLSLLLGAMRHNLVHFQAEGAAAGLAATLVLSTVALVLPLYTSAPGPTFTGAQLAFAAVASLMVYGMYVSMQTHRHREFFLPVDRMGEVIEGGDDDHAPSARQAGFSLGLLLVCLIGVVGLAKAISPAIEAGVSGLGLPATFVGVLIALVVLAPEALAAGRAARRDRLQTSFNLAYGSAVASIGLTIPVMAMMSPWFAEPLGLGLSPLHQALLAATALVSMLTVVPGRATRLQGALHLVLLLAYVFLAAYP